MTQRIDARGTWCHHFAPTCPQASGLSSVKFSFHSQKSIRAAVGVEGLTHHRSHNSAWHKSQCYVVFLSLQGIPAARDPCPGESGNWRPQEWVPSCFTFLSHRGCEVPGPGGGPPPGPPKGRLAYPKGLSMVEVGAASSKGKAVLSKPPSDNTHQAPSPCPGSRACGFH